MDGREIGERIKNLRERYNLTQEELAEIAKVTKAAVSRWEKGESRTLKSSTIKNICNHFKEINPAWFLGGDTPMLLQSKEAQNLAMIISNKLDRLDEHDLKKILKFIEEFL